MSASAYEKHWAIFARVAGSVIVAAQDGLKSTGLLVEAGGDPSGDEERSLGFIVSSPHDREGRLFVDLCLLDGTVRGFGPAEETGASQVGLSLAIVDASGSERLSLIPFNYTEDLGVSTAAELVERVSSCFDADRLLELVQGVAAGYFKGAPAAPVPAERTECASAPSPAPGL